jgi:uncharacterized membrane protein
MARRLLLHCGMKTAAVLLFLAACTSSPTGATCPTANAPTYGSFGEDFMTKYCTGCHSSETGNRHGAPTDINLDSEADVIKHASDIDETAASGPKASNTSMPDMSGPVHAAPTEAEREQLGQFLACETAK